MELFVYSTQIIQIRSTLGSDEQVSINQMIEIIEDVSGTKKLERVYQLDKPKV